MRIIGTWFIEWPPAWHTAKNPTRRFWFWTETYSMGYPVKRKEVTDLYFGKLWLGGIVRDIMP